MPDKKLSSGPRKVRNRKQEKQHFCGPAVAQMILGGLGVNRTQNSLWDVIQDHFDALGLPKCEPCGAVVECVEIDGSPPEALAAALDQLTNVPIKLVSETNVAATDHAVVWSITNDVAAAVLVEGWQHWVVAYGYRADRWPANANDTGYVLKGFHLRDPWQSEPATRFVTAARWRADYLTGVPCGRFKGRFVAICDPDVPLPKRGPTVATTKLPPPRKASPVPRLLSAPQAAQAAVAGIREAALLDDPVWRTAMLNATPGEPRLVHRLDRPQSFYYLVPLARSSRVTVQAMVDGSSGELLEAQAADGAKRSLATAVPPSVVADQLARTRIDVPGWRRDVQLRREGLVASPTLVWRPCRESPSPYVPFTLVTYGEHRFYVRADGEVFTALTQSGFGT